jgi:hypothetical protein
MDEAPDENERRPKHSPAVSTRLLSSADQLDQFCALALRDVALQERLRSPDETLEFIALTVETARNCGFRLDPQDLWNAMGRLPGSGCSSNREWRETSLPPEGWLPTETIWQHGQLYLQWSHFGKQRLREPFFEGDIQRCRFKPFSRLFHHFTPVTRLAEWLQDHPGLQPSGFIFHMSRCGSTLVAQMLASLDRNVVVAEAPPLDAVVRARKVRPDLGDDQHDHWLAWMVGALGQPRSGNETNYYIKLDCWHTLALPLLRRVFPAVPWIFLYRDPVEVLVSQLRMPGIQMIPGMLGANLFDLEPPLGRQAREDYCACVLARICEPVLTHYPEGAGLLVNYRELPHALWTKIMPHFGVKCSGRDRAMMADMARFDAKTPSFEFASDIDAKQRAASAIVRAVAEQRLGEIYRRLERINELYNVNGSRHR